MKNVGIIFLMLPLLGFAQVKQKITGGQDAGQYEFLFQAGIADKIGSTRDPENSFCGGSVIADEWILTAAHCMYDDNGNLLTPSQLFVFLNTWKLSSPNAQKEYIDASQIIIHPQYDDNTIENDIALIKLKTKTNIKPITLPAQGDESLLVNGQKCTVSGWGYLNSAGTQLPDKLQKVEVEVISTTTCNAPAWYDNEVLAGMFCAGYESGVKDACGGDSGGPLFVMKGGDTTQIGIVSWGYDCGEAKKPGIYTKISDYRTWINTSTSAFAGISPLAEHTWYTASQGDGLLTITNTTTTEISFRVIGINGQQTASFSLKSDQSHKLVLPRGVQIIESLNGTEINIEKTVIW